jgi:sugar (pentulose or hexulose) kinase
MDNQDFFKLHGALTLTLFKADGTIDVTHKDNIIVNAGFDLICDALGAVSRPASIGYIGVGTGVVAAAVADTALGTQTLRQAATYAHTAGTKVFTMTTTFAAGAATAALTEAGVFNAASAGTMLDRVIFPVINKGAADTLQAVFTFTLS